MGRERNQPTVRTLQIICNIKERYVRRSPLSGQKKKKEFEDLHVIS